jgi:hypothetical protein
VLLGAVKYLWGQTIFVLRQNGGLKEFQARLHALQSSGLDVSSILAEYMIKHCGNLIGKHFKIQVQVVAFALSSLIPADLLEFWISLGRLCVLIWTTSIANIDDYCVSAIAFFAPQISLIWSYRNH